MDEIITFIQAYWYAIKARRLYKMYDMVQIDREGMLIAGNYLNKTTLDSIHGQYDTCYEEELPKKFRSKILDYFKVEGFPKRIQEKEPLYTLVQTVSDTIGRAPILYAPGDHVVQSWVWCKSL